MSKTELKKKKLMLQIKRTMENFNRAFDRSIKQQKVTYCFEPSSNEFKKLFKILVDLEKRCIELDRKLYELFIQYQLTKYE